MGWPSWEVPYPKQVGPSLLHIPSQILPNILEMKADSPKALSFVRSYPQWCSIAFGSDDAWYLTIMLGNARYNTEIGRAGP